MNGREKSDTQKFWLGLLRDILDLEKPEEYIDFEKTVELSHKSFIDAYIPSTGIVIEQKSQSVNLDAPAKQSDGTLTTPFEQAKRYRDWLPCYRCRREKLRQQYRGFLIRGQSTQSVRLPICMMIQRCLSTFGKRIERMTWQCVIRMASRMGSVMTRL